MAWTRKKTDLLAAAALALLCLAAYHGSLTQYFWEDDFFCIEIGKKAFGHDGYLFAMYPNFRPLDRLAFYINYAISGMAPFGYHAFNIGGHLLNAVLLYVLLINIFSDRLLSFAGAAAFVSTNSQSDCVFWVAARSGIISLSLLLLALISWTWYRKKEGGRDFDYLLSLVFLALAMFAKEEGVVYPALVALTDMLLIGKGVDARNRWRAYMGLAAIMVAYLVFQAVAQASPTGRSVNITGGGYGAGSNVPVNIVEMFYYLFVPSFAGVPPSNIAWALSLAVVALVAIAGYKAGRVKETIWALVFMTVSFMPMSLFKWDLLDSVDGSFIRRYFYAPSVGWAVVVGLFVAWAREALGGKRLATAAVSVFLLLVVGWGAFLVNWREGLWRGRSDYVQAEVDAVTELYPALPPGRGGVLMRGFIQKELFNDSMLRLVYGRDDLKVYGDEAGFLKAEGLAFRVRLAEKDAVVGDEGGRVVPLRAHDEAGRWL